MLHKDLTEKILGAFYKVNNTLGYGFLEKVYENALAYELKKMGYLVQQQPKITVYYDGQQIGEYYADLVVENKIILEIKAAEKLCQEHEAQLINYLRATKFEVGLLLNFGKKAEFRRKIFTNDRKRA